MCGWQNRENREDGRRGGNEGGKKGGKEGRREGGRVKFYTRERQGKRIRGNGLGMKKNKRNERKRFNAPTH